MLTRRQLLVGAATAPVLFGASRLLGFPVAVDWMWSGGVSDTEASVVAKFDAALTSCRLKVSTASDLSASPIFSDAVADDANGYAKMTVAGLAANTDYFYGVEIDGLVDPLRGQFRTLPTPGTASSFHIAFGSCSEGDVDFVYDAIRARRPLFLAHVGDFFYLDPTTNDQAQFRTAYETAMAASRREQMHREIANAYVWDNHDYGDDSVGGEGADTNATSRPAAAAVYRQVVPHFTLPAGAGDNPIYQTWRAGRVRFIQTDLRHQRSPNADTDNASKTMLGATQKQWLKDTFDDARDEGTALIVWLNSQVWRVDSPFAAFDQDNAHWGGYSTERAELANYVKDNDIPQVVILGGDAHMIAYDDGSNADYATGGGAPMPEFHASPFDHVGNIRGTDWMSAPIGNGPHSHYGMVRFDDDGTRIAVTFRAYTVDRSTGADTLTRQFLFQTAPWGNKSALPMSTS